MSARQDETLMYDPLADEIGKPFAEVARRQREKGHLLVEHPFAERKVVDGVETVPLIYRPNFFNFGKRESRWSRMRRVVKTTLLFPFTRQNRARRQATQQKT